MKKKSTKKTEAVETTVATPAVETPEPAPEASKPKGKGKPTKVTKAKPEKKISALDAAAKVLGEAGEPLNCPAMIEAMSKKGYWSSPNGLTPHATLYAAILREINTKDKDSRFKKADRGHFTLNG